MSLEALSVPERLPPGSRAARPKPAASLLIFHGAGEQRRVLMGRRSPGHDFMPGAWVFPGGRVDRGDFSAPQGSELSPETARILSGHLAPARGRALAMAAIRETFEETGLLLALPARTRPGAGAWRPFLEAGALPDLAALDVVARAVTPPMLGRRFDTWFLMADASRLIGLEPGPGCGELQDIAWLGVEDALAMDLQPITRFILDVALQRLHDRARPRPYVRMLRGVRVMNDL